MYGPSFPLKAADPDQVMFLVLFGLGDGSFLPDCSATLDTLVLQACCMFQVTTHMMSR